MALEKVSRTVWDVISTQDTAPSVSRFISRQSSGSPAIFAATRLRAFPETFFAPQPRSFVVRMDTHYDPDISEVEFADTRDPAVAGIRACNKYPVSVAGERWRYTEPGIIEQEIK